MEKIKQATLHPLAMGLLWVIQIIVLPMIGWLALTVIDQGQEITRLQAERAGDQKLLSEIRTDVKTLLIKVGGEGP